MLMNDAQITTADQMRETAAKIVEPIGPRPCDCEHCECYNTFRAQMVAVWDVARGNADRIRALPIAAPQLGQTLRDQFVKASNQGQDAPVVNVSQASPQTVVSPTNNDLTGFQTRVEKWVRETFGDEIMDNPMERCARFYEEATELVVAGGLPRETAVQLLHDAYQHPEGQVFQEVGSVMVTLAALCANQTYSVELKVAAFRELTRIWENRDKIRKKHFSKSETLRPHTWKQPEIDYK